MAAGEMRGRGDIWEEKDGGLFLMSTMGELEEEEEEVRVHIPFIPTSLLRQNFFIIGIDLIFLFFDLTWVQRLVIGSSSLLTWCIDVETDDHEESIQGRWNL